MNDGRRLAREINDAFTAIGSAVADTRFATKGWCYETNPTGFAVTSPGIEEALKKTQYKIPIYDVNKKFNTKPACVLQTKHPQFRASAPCCPQNRRWKVSDMTPNRLKSRNGGRLFNREMVDKANAAHAGSYTYSHLESALGLSALDLSQGTTTSTPRQHCPSNGHNSAVAITQDSASKRDSRALFRDHTCFRSATLMHGWHSQSLTTIPESSYVLLAPVPVAQVLGTRMPRFTRSGTRRGVRLSSRNMFTSPCFPSRGVPANSKTDLHSTPFTLTSPFYRHGVIKVLDYATTVGDGNVELVSSRGTVVGNIGKGIDVTDFQMAILGGAGEFLRTEPGEVHRAEADDFVDIDKWWDEFRLGAPGRFIRESDVARHTRTKVSDTRGQDILEKVCVNIEAERTGLQPGQAHRNHQLRVTASIGITASRKTYEYDSGPPSPMMEITLGGPHQIGDIVPMGFNLGHDLEDFLKWESKHAEAIFLEHLKRSKLSG